MYFCPPLPRLGAGRRVGHNEQETLTEMQPRLAQAAVDTEILIKKVTADQLAADEQQAIVEKDVEEANKVAANVQVIKDDCQKVRVCARVCDVLWSARVSTDWCICFYFVAVSGRT